MGLIVKASFWGTCISYSGVIIGYFNSLYLRAKYFDLEQIGLFTLITSNAMIIVPLTTFGTGSAFNKFFPAFNKSERTQFFNFMLLIVIGANLLIFIVCYFFRDFIITWYSDTAPDYIRYLLITVIIVVSVSFFNLFYNYSLSIKKVVFPSFLLNIYLRSGILLLILGVATDWWTFDSALWGVGFIYVSSLILLLFQLFFFHDFRFDFNWKFMKRDWGIKWIHFSGYATLMALSSAVLQNVSYLQITSQLGPDMMGIYHTCFFIALIVEMPKSNLLTIMVPFLSIAFQNNNMEEVEKLYKKSSITLSIIAALLLIGITSNLNDLFSFIPKGAKFQQGYWVVIGVCFAKFAEMVSCISPNIISFSPLYRYNLLFQMTSAVSLIILNYVFIPIWGLNGAISAYLLTIFLNLIMKIVFVKIRFDMHPFVKGHIKLIVIIIFIWIGIHFIQPSYHPILNIGIRSFITFIVFTLIIYHFKISADINRLIHSIFERVLRIKLQK